MTPLAERIYQKIQTLTREKDDVHNQINRMKQALDQVKRATHRTEMNIAVDGAASHTSGMPDARLAHELRELSQEKKELHDDEQALNDLTRKYNDLEKMIDDHRFWMYRADTTDLSRQQEAEKKIFG